MSVSIPRHEIRRGDVLAAAAMGAVPPAEERETMGKLTVTTFVTLDGVMQAPGGPPEDPSGGFAHGGWIVPLFGDDAGKFIDGVMARADAFLLGRRTYEIFAGHWPRFSSEGNPVAHALNTLPKHVASTCLHEVAWQNSSLLGRDLAAEIARLKKRYPRELQVHGSCGLLQTLWRLDLVDELNLVTFPLVLGEGKRLFGGGALPTALSLAASQTTSKGVVISSYRSAGRPTYGSFMLEP